MLRRDAPSTQEFYPKKEGINIKTSANGLKFITEEEGKKLKVYLDIKGLPTIGVGHLIKPGEDFSEGLTDEQVENLLASDISEVDNVLSRIAPNLTQNQHDCCADFGFNLGVGALRQLLSHGIDQIPVQILKWDHAGAVEVKALKNRRKAELALFNTVGEPDVLAIIAASRKD